MVPVRLLILRNSTVDQQGTEDYIDFAAEEQTADFT
ncbi:hypothetical protein NIES4073_71030 [Kalymmatonema gypsitolerans NIES-4073]|nr:hypothetical protein NIES4073_71030 [Scytonema sp. NIES-4073]